MNKLMNSQIKADLALLGVAAIWGITFTVIKGALEGIGPYYFIAIRFWIAFVFLAGVYWKNIRNLDQITFRAGVVVGVFLFAGYAFQTVGLKYTSASNAGFITGLAVVLVPVLMAVYSRRVPGKPILAGVLLASGGLAALTLDKSLNISYGDFLIFLCAISFAMHIIMVGRYAPKYNPVTLAVVQIGIVALLSTFCGFALEEMPRRFSREVWIALLVTSLPATALALLIQNSVQRYTTPTHTAIIFTMEPVFAAASAWYLGGEILTPVQLAGCLFILAGMLLAEIKVTRKKGQAV